ncbi:hypothetical protein HanIR_Chr13g0637921 [Helianthus annuus]|nr:hypothetical protein HanIR_Chr13g0637921 [Helianthus annuus]
MAKLSVSESVSSPRVLKNDCWLFRGFRKTISSQGNESSSYQAHLTQRTTYTTKKVVASHPTSPG